MSRNEKDTSLPSYEDTINSPFSPQTSTQSRGQLLLDNLTLVRAQHLRSVVNESVFPIVERQALHGIAGTTIALIPSDVPLPAPSPEKSEFSFDTGNEKQIEVIGYSSDDGPQVVRLEGQLNKTEFWRSLNIIQEFERVLRDSLNTSPHFRPPSPMQQPTLQTTSTRPRKGLFGRIANALNQEERSPGGNPEVGIRQQGYDAGGQVAVRARVEELCLRTTNEFGLYDTISKPCIIIRVDARC